jgi:hypothetical protein
MPPYRGPLQWLPEAPTAHELVVMTLLLVGRLVLVLLAWRFVRSYVGGWWEGPLGPEHGQVLVVGVCASAAGLLLWRLWHQLEHIAARMRIGVLVLMVLLADELHSGKGGRSHRRH